MSPRKHEVPDELLSSLLANYKKPEDLIGENGLLKQLTKLLVEKALDAEMTEHLGHEKHEPVANGAGNTRNGRSRKTLKGEFGELPIEVPRDRQGSFEPKLIPKHQTRWSGFDDKILSLYARGMTVREIQAHLEEMYGAEVSPSLISSVTDAVVDEVKAWQSRPLDPVYPIVYLDCIHVKVRDGAVRVKAVYLAIGITMSGESNCLDSGAVGSVQMVPHAGVEDDQQFAHGCHQGDLGRFAAIAERLVEGPQSRFVAHCGQRTHVQRGPKARPAAPDAACAAQGATVAGQGCNAHQLGDGLATEATQLGQLRSQGRAQHRPHALDLAQHGQAGLLGHLLGDAGIQRLEHGLATTQGEQGLPTQPRVGKLLQSLAFLLHALLQIQATLVVLRQTALPGR